MGTALAALPCMATPDAKRLVERIVSAIHARRRLGLGYDGHERLVEPHILGEDHRGQPLLSAFQVTGGSTTGEPFGWKNFDLRKIEELPTAGKRFAGPRPDYNPDDPTFALVVARL